MITVGVLAEARYKVVAMPKGGTYPAHDFLSDENADFLANRAALVELLEMVSVDGLNGLPTALCHLADQKNGIYEFVKGRLRLYFFKGVNGDIAVCTVGTVKKTQKVDPAMVDAAKKMKAEYHANAGNINYEDLSNGTE